MSDPKRLPLPKAQREGSGSAMNAIVPLAAILIQLAIWQTIGQVFGVDLSKASPDQLVRALGPSVRQVRHYWSEREMIHVRDDGWDWWRWDEANADVQAYWGPAYPMESRRIRTIVLCKQFAKGKTKSIKPSGKGAHWLKGFKIGMPQSSCVERFTKLFGKPTMEFGQFVWSDAKCKLELSVEKGRVTELTIEVM